MRATGFGLLAFLAAVSPAQQSTPTFRAATRLVELTVTALDSKGNPVTGLRPEDFAIEDSGKKRPIAFFSFEGAPELGTARKLASGTFTNNPEAAGGAPRNITALVLDSLNTPAQYSVQARAQVVRYLKALAPETQVAVYNMGSDLVTLHGFTDDAGSLRARVEKAKLQIPLEATIDIARSAQEADQLVDLVEEFKFPQMAAVMEENMRAKIDAEMAANAAARYSRMIRTLEAMSSLGQHLSGIPGRKSLVWITAGFSMTEILGELGMGVSGSTRSFEDKVRAVSQGLAQQGVVLYIVDVHGIESKTDYTSVQTPRASRSKVRFEDQVKVDEISQDTMPAMTLMADVTGGRYLFNTNDLNVGFKQALSDLRGAYTLGFYAPEDGAGKWHKLRVKVARGGVSIRYREGYYAENGAEQPADWDRNAWLSAVANPLGSSSIPLTLRCEPAAEGGLHLSIRISGRAVQFRKEGGRWKASLQLMIAGKSADGRAWTSLSDLAAELPEATDVKTAEIPLSRQWTPDAAVKTLRVIVRDKSTGQYGSVDAPLDKIPDK